MNNTSAQASLRTILVVDDDEFSRDLLRKKLAFWGVTDIHTANNGREGMAVLQAMPRAPDFLVCDVFMPDMDGIEFIGALAKREFKGGLILITGVNQGMLHVAQVIATMKGLSVLGIFTKPLDHDALGQVMGFSTL